MMILRILGAVWVLPIALPIWLVYLGPAWALGWHALGYAHPTRLVLRFRIRTAHAPAWYLGLWSRWAGLALPFAATLRASASSTDTVRHELRHCDQWLWLGPLFPIVYGALLAIYGYRRHPLERDARRWARSGEGE